tara:strand:+ start:952 stop:1893 length:942 start_codon:yes stop_codon:yes gene_type:complete
MQKNPKFIQKYLKFVGSDQSFIAKKAKCDVCGSLNNTIIRDRISWNNGRFGILPVSCCNFCGFLFQKYKFNKRFYQLFYSEYYRKIIFNDIVPSSTFIKDQESRGKKLFKFLKNHISKNGNMIDIGCGIGTMLRPFLKNGWQCEGNDPDFHFVSYGKQNLKLPVKCLQSEDMQIKKNYYDLVIIMGSLEHCYDPNKVLSKCSISSKKNALLVLEARGDPQSNSINYFNHNHHRYFSKNSLELIMIKHGWMPILTTSYPITGPTRKGGIYCIGKYTGKKISSSAFRSLISSGKKESFDSVDYRFKYHDYIHSLK